jgi:sporulation protein YlmC with PRC-barrel domain
MFSIATARSNLEFSMKMSVLAGFATLTTAALATVLATPIHAQVAGSTTVGVEVTELSDVALGWSVKRQILGRNVYNENGERVGKVDDLIVTPDKALSFAIIGAGGFVGFGHHDIAIPVNLFQRHNGRLVLPGATKEAIKAMPNFEYSAAQ